MELRNSKTFENLKKAFIAECSARTRYEFVEYGQRAKGYESLAKITDEIAYQEFNHARMLYTHIEKVTNQTIDNEEVCVSLPFRQRWDMEENLRLSARDEGDEAVFYLEAQKIAEEEGFLDIANLFKMIRQVELKHQKIFNYLYEKLKDDTLFKSQTSKRWTCPSCGYEAADKEAFEVCPLCNAKMETLDIPLPRELML